jgi:hypothetical protein
MAIFSEWLFWLAILALAGWHYLILWRGAFWRAEALPDPAVSSEQRLPDVIAVVPARNEAPYLARTLHSLIAQDYPGQVCVILVDDSSEDLTHAIAEATRTRPCHMLEVISARPRPKGWSGKLWAVSEGLRRDFGCRTRRLSCSLMPTSSTISAMSGGWLRKRKRTGWIWSRSCSGFTAIPFGSGC